MLPKAVYIFNAIPIKLTMSFFSEQEQITVKYIGNHERLRICKRNLEEKEQSRRPSFSRLQTIHKATVIKTVFGIGTKSIWTNGTE